MTCIGLVENKGIKMAKKVLYTGVALDALPGSAIYVFQTAGTTTV